MAAVVLGLLLFAPYGVISDTVAENYFVQQSANDRLAKIEAVLESVLMKNAGLERRIEVLEEQNRHLKGMLEFGEQTHNTDEGKDDNAVDTGEEGGKSIVQNHRPKEDKVYKKRNDRVSRMLLATGDVTVGFTAVISTVKVASLGRAQTIIYEKTITNVGGGYHNHTGVFIAPVSGVYGFTVDLMVEPGDDETLEIVKDGKSLVGILAHGTGESRYESSSRTVVLHVSRGSEVWVRTYDSTGHGKGILHGNKFSSFSGWLVAITE